MSCLIYFFTNTQISTQWFPRPKGFQEFLIVRKMPYEM